MKNSSWDNRPLKGRKLFLEPLETRALLSVSPAFCGPPSYEQWLAREADANVVRVVSASETEPSAYCVVLNRVAELRSRGPLSNEQNAEYLDLLQRIEETRVRNDEAFASLFSEPNSEIDESAVDLVAKQIVSEKSDSKSVTVSSVLDTGSFNVGVDSNVSIKTNDRSGNDDSWTGQIDVRELHTSISVDALEDDYANLPRPILERQGIDSAPHWQDFVPESYEYDYVKIKLPNPEYGYKSHITITSDIGTLDSEFVVLRQEVDSFSKLTAFEYSGGSNTLYIVPVKNTLTSNMTITINLYDRENISGNSGGGNSGGGNLEPQIVSSIDITVIASKPSVIVSWEQDGTNGPALSSDPVCGGLRIYPEKTNPNDVLAKDTVRLRFQLNETVSTDTIVYFKVFDPDNRISLGRNQEIDQLCSQNDNYLTSLTVVNGLNDIPSLSYQTVYNITIPANYDWVDVTLKISDGYAGDNFIAIADTNYQKTVLCSLGADEYSRYQIQYDASNLTVSQTQLLTVWRTLWMEIDQMLEPNLLNPSSSGFTSNTFFDDPTNINHAPRHAWNYVELTPEPNDFDVLRQPGAIDISLAKEHLEKSCITLKKILNYELCVWKAIREDQLSSPPFQRFFVSENYESESEYNGRDISLCWNTSNFWVGHALTAYNENESSESVPAYYGLGKATLCDFFVYDETIRDLLANSSYVNEATLSEARDRVFYHEILHRFLGDHLSSNSYSVEGIMKEEPDFLSLDFDINLSNRQICEIKKNLLFR